MQKKKKKMSNRKGKILVISSIIIAVLLIIGGIFWAQKNNSPSQPPGSNNPPDDNDQKKEKYICTKCNQEFDKKDKPPKDGKYCSDKCKNEADNKYTCSNCNKEFTDAPTVKNGKKYCVNCKDKGDDENKVELKVFWAGSLSLANDDWKDYWVFSEAKEGKWAWAGSKRFLIAKNTPVLVDKDLWQEDLLFNLSYSKKKGSKVEKSDKDGNPRLTMVKSDFVLTPLSPTKGDPDFLNRWENTKSKELYFDYSKYVRGDFIFIDNQILAGRDEKDCDKFVFHPENLSIQELLAKNHLQNQSTQNDKQFRVFYLERDIEKRTFLGNSCTYYLNNQAKVRTAISRP